jgi:DNA-binding MarR family transcriptional regulator
MKTVHPNSILSYRGLNLTQRQHEVITALQLMGEATDVQIADCIGYTVNRVTGRLTELIDKGIVIEDHYVIGEFGKRVRVCRLKNFSENLFQE